MGWRKRRRKIIRDTENKKRCAVHRSPKAVGVLMRGVTRKGASLTEVWLLPALMKGRQLLNVHFFLGVNKGHYKKS